MSNETMLIGNILGSILQPLYFCLFFFYAKQIKEKRALFIMLSIADYLIIQNFVKFSLGINADLIYAILFYINLKVFYKNTKITDFITYVLANIVLGIINVLSFYLLGMNEKGLLFALLVPIVFVLMISQRLNKIETFYNKYWNRKKNKGKIKSITIRGFSACLTIVLFIALHFWIIYLLIR